MLRHYVYLASSVARYRAVSELRTTLPEHFIPAKANCELADKDVCVYSDSFLHGINLEWRNN